MDDYEYTQQGYEVKDNGKLKISKVPNLDDRDGEYYYITRYDEYVAVATNDYGTTSYDFYIIHGTAPKKIDSKNTKTIILTNGKVEDQLDSTNLSDYGYGDVFWGVYKESNSSKVGWFDRFGKLDITGMPSGLSLQDNSYYYGGYVGYYLSGTLNLSGKAFKKYNVNLAVQNPWGKAKYKLVLDIREPATIDPSGTVKSPMFVSVGKKFKLKIPTKIKKPYTWKMTDADGKEIKGNIGSSGLTWEADKATISGTPTTVGKYDVTIWLDNEASATSKDYSIYVLKSAETYNGEDITGLTFKNDVSRNVDATLSSEKYSFSIPLQIVGWPRTGDNVKWTVTGGEKFGITAENIKYDSNSTSYSTYYLKAEKLDENLFAQLDDEGSSSGRYNDRYLPLTITADNAFGTAATVTVKVAFPDPGMTGVKFKEDVSRYIDATLSSGKYSVSVPLQIVGWPRTGDKVSWTVTGGEKFGITAENISYDSNSTSYSTYYLKAENLDKNLFDQLNSDGFYKSSGTLYYYYDRFLCLTITADNGFGTAATENVYIYFEDPDPYSSYYSGHHHRLSSSTSSAPTDEVSDSFSDLGSNYRLENLNMRGINDISAKNLTLIPNDYEVIAVLPEISVDESGLYEFDVKISDDIEPERELKYFAFSSEPSEDDEIAEFYNSDDEEITTLPEDHKLTVAAWFNKGKIYEPVIAVKKTPDLTDGN